MRDARTVARGMTRGKTAVRTFGLPSAQAPGSGSGHHSAKSPLESFFRAPAFANIWSFSHKASGQVSVRRPVPPAGAAAPADIEASLRGCGLGRRACSLPGGRREGDQLLFRHAPRQTGKDVSQVLDGVDAEQGAGRADRVRDSGTLGARM